MRRLLFATVLLAPLAAMAAQPCKFEAPRKLQLDLAGVRAVQIDVNSNDLHLAATDGAPVVEGRACASEQNVLDSLQITQRRDGDQLLIDIGGGHGFSINVFGSSYSNLEVGMKLPANLPVTVRVGSGDAEVEGLQALQAHVGSGDLHVRHIAGRFGASVGSGDIDASDLGSFELGSAGSGDVTAERIKGGARVGSVGSGDVTLRQVGGNVRVDTLGSGDLEVSDVAGDLSLGALGSGDVDHSGVKGKVSLPRDS